MNSPNVHIPKPSFWPLALALSLLLVAVGVLTTLIISALGILLVIACIVGWTIENQADEEEMRHHE